MTLHKTEDKLPPLGRYVLIYVPDRPWLDEDPEGVHWVVAKRVQALPFGNNERDYRWQAFGPDSFDGQEVVAWHELPRE